MTKWITGIAAALVIAVLAMHGSSVASAQGGTVPDPETEPKPEDVVLREGPTVSIVAVNGVIERGKDGHFQVVISNPLQNDYSIMGSVELNTSPTLYAYSAAGGPSGGVNLVLLPITDPIAPGTARAFDFFVQASTDSSSQVRANGRVTFWPTTGFNGVENRDVIKIVSWDTTFEVKESSNPFGAPAPTPTPDTTATPVITDGLSGDGFELETWMYFVIAILGILALIAIMRIIMN